MEVVHWIVEVSPAVRNEIRKEGRIFLEWSSCNARDWLGITRCYKCQGLGHAEKFCKAELSYCPYCAQSGHKLEACLSAKAKSEPKCINCVRANAEPGHISSSKDCPSYLKSLERLKASTKYDDDE